ncbi:MAG: Gfo/Idh/MocA family oxidoreductase [Pseudomonadota bacterium]
MLSGTGLGGRLSELNHSNRPKIGVIGCGDWGVNHVKTLAAIGALYSVSDIKQNLAQSVAGQYQCHTMSADEMIGHPNIDGIVLALPPEKHVSYALKVLEQGKHLLVEKPMALDTIGAKKLVDAAERSGSIAMTGHVIRFHPAFEKLENLINSGELGNIKYAFANRIGFGKFYASTDALWDIAPHDLSLLLAITKELPSRVHIEGVSAISSTPDFAHMHLKFPSGMRSHIFISRLVPYKERRLAVIGDRAIAIFEDTVDWDKKLAIYSHKIWGNDNNIKFQNGDAKYIRVANKSPLEAELEHFIDCIENGKKPKSSIKEGLDVLQILDQAAMVGPNGQKDYSNGG